MKKKKVYKVFIINDDGTIKLYSGQNFNSEGEAQIHVVECKCDFDLIVLTCYVSMRI